MGREARALRRWRIFDVGRPGRLRVLDRAGLYQWGPDLPDDFIDANSRPGHSSQFEDGRDPRPRLKKVIALEGSFVDARAPLAMIVARRPGEEERDWPSNGLSDIAAIEAVPLVERDLPGRHLATLAQARNALPRATLTFFSSQTTASTDTCLA